MHKLKYLLLIFFLIIISFLICALTPSSQKKEYDLYLNIPEQHKIKIINPGHGSILVDNIKRNNGETINCERFSNLTLVIIPDDNYEITKITFNNEDITSNLNSNKITLHSITKDGTLTFNFKDSAKSVDNNIEKKTTKVITIFSNFIHRIDYNIFIICLLLVIVFFPLICAAYYIFKK